MPNILTQSPELVALQQRSETARSNEERLIYLERQVRILLYLAPERAYELLEKGEQLYRQDNTDALPFYFHLHRANFASLAYDTDTAQRELEAALIAVEAHGDPVEKIEVLLDYVGILINHQELQKARQHYEQAERLLESYPNTLLGARALVRAGFIYLHAFSFPQAIPRFLEADAVFHAHGPQMSLKDHYFYTLLHSGLGTLQLRSGKFAVAAASFRKAIDRCEQKGMRARLVWHQLKLADTLMARQQYVEAKNIYRTIIEQEGQGSQQALAATCHNLALCLYHAEDQPDKTRVSTLLTRAENLFQELPSPDWQKLISIGVFRAQLAFDKGDFAATATTLLQQITDLRIDEHNDNPAVVGAAAEMYRLLAECKAKLEDFQAAYHYRLYYDFYNERQQELEGTRQQEEFAARFEAAAWEKERESLQLRASQLQLRALQAQMNPHFLFNALNSIQSFITTHDVSTASRYLAKFAMMMRRSLEYSNREYISLEDEIQFLTEYLDVNCKLRFRDKLHYSIRVAPALEEDIIGVPTMIIQPYVENAIEHGLRSRQGGNITIDFSPNPQDEDTIMATILDDGIGRAQAARMHAADATRRQHQSRGTSITQSRLELLSQNTEEQVCIEDLYHPDGTAAGTRVRVKIPVADSLPRRTH